MMIREMKISGLLFVILLFCVGMTNIYGMASDRRNESDQPPSREFIEETVRLYNSCMKDTADYISLEVEGLLKIIYEGLDWRAFRESIDFYIERTRDSTARHFVSDKWNMLSHDRGANSKVFLDSLMNTTTDRSKAFFIKELGNDFIEVPTVAMVISLPAYEEYWRLPRKAAKSLLYPCYKTFSKKGMADEFDIVILFDDKEQFIGVEVVEYPQIPLPD